MTTEAATGMITAEAVAVMTVVVIAEAAVVVITVAVAYQAAQAGAEGDSWRAIMLPVTGYQLPGFNKIF